jgi:hypothetical protein
MIQAILRFPLTPVSLPHGFGVSTANPVYLDYPFFYKVAFLAGAWILQALVVCYRRLGQDIPSLAQLRVVRKPLSSKDTQGSSRLLLDAATVESTYKELMFLPRLAGISKPLDGTAFSDHLRCGREPLRAAAPTPKHNSSKTARAL